MDVAGSGLNLRNMPSWCALQPDVAQAHGVAVGRLETRGCEKMPKFGRSERIPSGELTKSY